jgi:RecB family endonuclease NucS
MAELKRTVERTSKAVDSLTTRWGRFVEELVEPAVLRLFQEKGIDIKEVYPRARVKRQGIAMEIDILAVDDTDLVVVECKSRLSKDDVDEFIEKLTRFKIAFPHYQNYQAYGAVAGIEINQGIDRYAYKKGLFVIKPSGDTVVIINDADFQPNTW